MKLHYSVSYFCVQRVPFIVLCTAAVTDSITVARLLSPEAVVLGDTVKESVLRIMRIIYIRNNEFRLSYSFFSLRVTVVGKRA